LRQDKDLVIVTCNRGRCCVDRCLDCLEVGQEPQTVKALENKQFI